MCILSRDFISTAFASLHLCANWGPVRLICEFAPYEAESKAAKKPVRKDAKKNPSKQTLAGAGGYSAAQ